MKTDPEADRIDELLPRHAAAGYLVGYELD